MVMSSDWYPFKRVDVDVRGTGRPATLYVVDTAVGTLRRPRSNNFEKERIMKNQAVNQGGGVHIPNRSERR